MDVLVKWRDNSVNCVSTKELKTMKKNAKFKVGTAVKMMYMGKWYYGTIITTETEDPLETSSSEDNEPLSKLVERMKNENVKSLANSREITAENKQCQFQIPSMTFAEESTAVAANLSEENELNGNNRHLTNVVESKQNTQESNFPEPVFALQPDTIISGCENLVLPESFEHGDPFSNIDLSDKEDRKYVQTCEVCRCKRDVFSSCFRCSALLCWDHFDEDVPTCETHQRLSDAESDEYRKKKTKKQTKQKVKMNPEDFQVEGAPREYEPNKVARTNKKKTAKALRLSGAEYVSVDTKKTVPGRKLGPPCNSAWCKKGGRQCDKFSEKSRDIIFQDFYKLESLHMQREFIARYLKQQPKKCSTTEKSRRQFTNFFFLPLDGSKIKVCRKLFMNTLDITEKTIRTTLEKIQDSGVIKKDQRGGRPHGAKLKDQLNRQKIMTHINRFERVESHYCRKDSSRQYLHSDLTLKRMYTMFVNELEPGMEKPSFTTYREVFKTTNLSFHRPKKDLCGICKTYFEGSVDTKLKMQDSYDAHIKSKNAVRDIKDTCKIAAQNNNSLLCMCFDLQQVLYLPISNDGAIFYKRRFAVYNLTFYDIASRECYCFTWNECDSGRGASEISTALFKTLLKYDEKKVHAVDLFADGCGGQNRNSIVATALLHIISQLKGVEKISLRFFTTNHGQSEGDSAHSAISYAVKKAGDLFVPSQFIPIFRLARPSKPYEVFTLGFDDFLDFKKFSEELRVRSIRSDDTGLPFKWTDMVEFQVRKNNISQIFFKTSHLDQNYRSLTLKRQNESVLSKKLNKLNQGPRPISTEKYNDLIDLCSGPTPVIKVPEHVQFYKSLPHKNKTNE